MKFVCLQENLEKALSLTTRVVSGKNPLPITANIFFKTDKKGIEITATDLENTVKVSIPGKVEKEGGILLPMRTCIEIVAALPKEQIVVETQEQTAKVKGGRYDVKINGISPAEFPELPPMSSTSEMSLHDMPAQIKPITFAASSDESRAVLTGVLIILKTTDITMVATDGYRLSLKKFSKQKRMKDGEEVRKVIVPAKILTEVARIALEKGREGGNELLAFDNGNKQVSFLLDDAKIFSRLIEGEYPAYEKIIPPSFETKAVFDREEFLAAVKLSSVFARESANIIKLRISKEGMRLSANAPQVGENTCEVEGASEGEENEIAFNSRFLLEFLTNIDTKEIVFEMTGPLNPGVFKIPGDDSYLHIIMPVRVQG